MKVFTFFAFALLAAASAAAQPVRDIVDAQEAVRVHQRDMQPVIEQVREMAALLNAFANIQRDLSDPTQPMVAVEKALSDINEYAADAARRNALVDRESRATIEATRRVLEAARHGAGFGNLTELRERIHHNAIHPLQRRAVQMNRHVEIVVRMYDALASTLRSAQSAAINNLERLAMDPEKP